jgi:quercetin dioxygenase-like cupin family protein
MSDVDHSQVGRNAFVVNIDDLRQQKGDGRWNDYIVATDVLRINVISQPPGTASPGKPHNHNESDEAWLIVAGEADFHVQGEPVRRAKTGDWIFVPKGVFHEVIPVGEGPHIRVAIVAPNDRDWTIPSAP